MSREIFVEGVQVTEDGEEEYFIEGVQVNEDQAAAGGVMLKRFATMQGGIGANLTTGNMSGGMNA